MTKPDITIWALGVSILLGIGCASLPEEASGIASEPDVKSTTLCDAGKFHEAMRELAKEMEAWAEYTRRTGSTMEGAAGFLYSQTMNAIVIKGERDWGKILDDPKIPYEYKTDMISEIAEARLGKGSVFSSGESNLIFLPRSGHVDSWEELHNRLRKEIGAKNAGRKD